MISEIPAVVSGCFGVYTEAEHQGRQARQSHRADWLRTDTA